MALSQEYIQRQQVIAQLVTNYKAAGVNHNQAWRQAEADYDSGNYQITPNANTGNTTTNQSSPTTTSTGHAYTGTNSQRYRFDTQQSRINADTRARSLGGNTNSNMADKMAGAANTQLDNTVGGNTTGTVDQWTSTRRPTDLKSVQQKILNSFNS